ncbi:MAG: hypothetical protein ACXV3F_07520 [Frankiaceae bacterium]
MMYRAAAAVPYDNSERVTAGLRGQLGMMALATGATPDWTTLAVEGPTAAVGLRGRGWFEWTATVMVDGGEDISDDEVDAAIWGAIRPAASVAAEETAPQAQAAL